MATQVRPAWAVELATVVGVRFASGWPWHRAWVRPYGVAVPVEFLSDEESARFDRYNGPPPLTELERFFFLDNADKAPVAKRRRDHNRLGFALQLTTVRYLGTFLADPLDVPQEVVDYLSQQLEVPTRPS